MHSDDSTNNSANEFDSSDGEHLSDLFLCSGKPLNLNSKKNEEINEIKDFESTGERLVIFSKHGNNMFKALKELREQGELLDLSLKVNSSGEEDVIHVHGCVLAAHSPFIRAFLRNEDTNRIINLTEWNKEVVECLVNWTYDGALRIKSSNCYELLDSSDFLCLGEVSQECTSYICDNLTVENCYEAHVIACRHPLPKFKERVTKFVSTNLVKLLQDNHLVDFPKDDLLSILKDDNLLLFNRHGFLISPEEEEMMLFELLKDHINLNKAHYLWPEILKNVLRYGLMAKSDFQRLVMSNDWLEECDERKECVEFLNNLKSLELSGKNLYDINLFWIRRRNGLKSIAYFWTREVANDVTFPELRSYEWFNDVISLSEEYTNPPLLFVTGMKLYTKNWDNHIVVSTIEVTYNTGKKFLHGNVTDDMRIHEFTLQPEERIVSAKGRSGWLIDQLCFSSNVGKTYGPYGGNDGSQRDFEPRNPGSYLAGISGCVSTSDGCTYVRRLRLAWGYVRKDGILAGDESNYKSPVKRRHVRGLMSYPTLAPVMDNVNGAEVFHMVL